VVAQQQATTSRLQFCGIVGAGTAVGALCRFETGKALVKYWGGGDLLATAIVNILGSFIIMMFATLTAPGGRYPKSERTRQFVMAGFCGGYTTRSLMGLNTFYLLIEGDWLSGAAYVVGVVGFSLAGALLGYGLALALNNGSHLAAIKECRSLS
jgi:CrcB protein